jgi:3-hydroxyisobutyrate dehydrogenase
MNIAFLGLGAMGSRMASHLIQADHTVTVWNRSADAAQALLVQGARWATTPADAARGADAVIAMLRDDEASRSVWTGAQGAFAGMAREALAIESSTLSMEWSREWTQAATAAGVAPLDAPVVGSRPQAEAAQLVFLVGGQAAAFERARPALEAMGAKVEHAGESGAGAAAKLAVNALFAVQVATVAELLGLARAQGLEPAKLVELLAATPTLSPAAKGASMSMLAANFAPMFPVDLVQKDMGYVHAAANFGAPMVEAVRGVLSRAQHRQLGDQNLTAVAQLY